MPHDFLPLSAAIESRRARLLVVDDQPLNIRLMHQVLAEQHDVFMATSGEQAIQFCQRTPPDLVLLDVVMPEMDGLEVCRRLKSAPDTAAIPVIFVTGGGQAEEENACWQAGGADFISKPVNPLTLQHRVQAHVRLKFYVDALRAMAFADGLTGIANRRLFDETLDSEWRRCGRSNATLALLMIDVDFFKRFNDHHGHQAGDDCLRRVAAALQSTLSRPFDLVARYGGEEFACILPETDGAGALRIAQLLELAVRQLGMAHGDSQVAPHVTVSIGCAAAHPGRGEDVQTLIRRADGALYRAKQQGRGCALLAEESGQAPAN